MTEKLKQNGEKLEKKQDSTTENSEVNQLESMISEAENSLKSFTSTLETVFAWTKMTKEQKQRADEIILSKEKIIWELKKVLSQLKHSKSELEIKSKTLDVYSSKNYLETEKSKEYLEMQDKITDLQKRVFELDEAQSILLKDFRLLSHWEKVNKSLSKKEIKEMKNISSTEFLQKPFSERLKYVTIWNIDSTAVSNGKIKELEINFSFDGKFNRQLYLNTTAGMILPLEVREVEVNWVTYSRNNLKWEFFSTNWKRLIIKDETKILIKKLVSKEDLDKEFKSKIDLSKYKNPIDKEIAIEAEKRWISESLALKLFSSVLKEAPDNLKSALLEDLFTEIDRKRWYYADKFGENSVEKDWKFSINFLSYLSEWNKIIFEESAKGYGYSDEQIKKAKVFDEDLLKYDWKLNLEAFAWLDVKTEDVQKIREMKRFYPWSHETVILFKIAAKVAWLPWIWATNSNLHYILWKESNWKVGVLNYTAKSMSLNQFKSMALNSNSKNPMWLKSTASGLWQLLLSNVDIFYPSWRKWIWDPIEEAVWFMRYIKDRYWNPDIAKSVYWKMWYFNHPTKWRQYKGFKEWY